MQQNILWFGNGLLCVDHLSYEMSLEIRNQPIGFQLEQIGRRLSRGLGFNYVERPFIHDG